MSDTFESPYFDGSIQEPSQENNQEPVQEQFYEDSTINHLKKLFPDRKTHMDTLLKLFKYCFYQPNKNILSKTADDVVEDITSTPISLDLGKVLQEQTNEITEYYAEEAKFEKRVAAIPMFIDFAYMYYVWFYDSEAPIHKLPMTMMKFKLIEEALAAPHDDLQAAFEHCIENSYILDMRIEKPPFMMRTELTPDQVREKLKIVVKPVCHDILTELLRLDQKRTKSLTV